MKGNKLNNLVRLRALCSVPLPGVCKSLPIIYTYLGCNISLLSVRLFRSVALFTINWGEFNQFRIEGVILIIPRLSLIFKSNKRICLLPITTPSQIKDVFMYLSQIDESKQWTMLEIPIEPFSNIKFTYQT